MDNQVRRIMNSVSDDVPEYVSDSHLEDVIVKMLAVEVEEDIIVKLLTQGYSFKNDVLEEEAEIEGIVVHHVDERFQFGR